MNKLPNFKVRTLTSIAMLIILASVFFFSQTLFKCIILIVAIGVFYEFIRMINDHYKNRIFPKAIWAIIALLYAGVPTIATIYVLENNAFIYMLALVISTDIGGYIFGSQIGGYKLAPKISPKKTWSGTIGGIFSGSIVAYSINPNFGIICPIILCIVSVIGDLIESAIKRRFNVKDSGSIFPGHGGFMDRADSMLATSIVLAIILFFNQGAF